MKIRRIVALAFAMLLALGVAQAKGTTSAREGKPAPDFEVQTLEGETFRLSEQLGKVVFLNVWATWCPPCCAEMPDIQKLAEAHPDDLVVIGVSIDDTRREAADFVRDNGYTYTFAMDSDGTISYGLYPTQYIPESVFIDPNGVVTSIETGGMSYAQMEQRYQDALKNAGKDESSGDTEKAGNAENPKRPEKARRGD